MQSVFSSFSDQQRLSLARLPYRVGLYISRSDMSGGDEADDQELQALEAIIMAQGQDFFKSEFVLSIMNTTIAQKESWPQWHDDLDDIGDDIDQGLDILNDIVNPRDMALFTRHLYDIGRVVAVAYREDRHKLGWLRQSMEQRRFKAYDQWCQSVGVDQIVWEEYLSISRDEKKALEFLADKLKLNKEYK